MIFHPLYMHMITSLTLSLTAQVNVFQELLVYLIVQLSLGGTKTFFRRYPRSPCEANRIAYARACAKQKRTFKKAKRLSWRKYISDISAKTPSSDVWKKIRKLQGKFVPTSMPVLKVNDQMCSRVTCKTFC